MKVTLNISKLLEQGKITKDEYLRLNSLADPPTTFINTKLLVGLSILAISISGVFLPRSPEATLLTGIGLRLFTIFISKLPNWQILKTISSLAGALFMGAGIIWMGEGSHVAFLLVTFLFALLGLYSKDKLLIILSVLSLTFIPTGITAESSWDYFMPFRDPILTISIHTILIIVGYQLSFNLRNHAEQLAIVAARTAVIVVNLGFWVGAIWGSSSGLIPLNISAGWFSIIWILTLVYAALWASRAKRPWLQNVLSLSVGIHLYTQWFTNFGVSLFTLLPAVILATVIAFLIWKYLQFQKLDIINKWF